MSRVLVKNASDPQQVRRAERAERRAAAEQRAALRAVLDTPEGRRVFWGLLSDAGVYRSIWSPNAQIHYNAGRQDFGHELQARLLEADENLYDLMAREARARARLEAGDAPDDLEDAALGRTVTEGDDG